MKIPHAYELCTGRRRLVGQAQFGCLFDVGHGLFDCFAIAVAAPKSGRGDDENAIFVLLNNDPVSG
jgi:hypothetical protein